MFHTSTYFRVPRQQHVLGIRIFFLELHFETFHYKFLSHQNRKLVILDLISRFGTTEEQSKERKIMEATESIILIYFSITAIVGYF